MKVKEISYLDFCKLCLNYVDRIYYLKNGNESWNDSDFVILKFRNKRYQKIFKALKERDMEKLREITQNMSENNVSKLYDALDYWYFPEYFFNNGERRYIVKDDSD